MSGKPNSSFTIWQIVTDNLMTGATIVTAILALILSQLGVIPDSLFSPIIVGLLGLLTTTILIEHRRMLSRLDRRMEKLSETLQLQLGAEVRLFHSSDSAIQYLIERTKSARVSVDQASIDKQRARRSDVRIQYEKAREQLIMSDRVKYRYIGIVDSARLFRAIKKVMGKRNLNNFFAAFRIRPADGLPLFSFTIFDKEEVVTRAPYEVGEDPVYIAVRSANVAILFVGYFEKLWHSSQKVNSVEEIDAMISSLNNALKSPDPADVA